jgi:hypothetical protein
LNNHIEKVKNLVKFESIEKRLALFLEKRRKRTFFLFKASLLILPQFLRKFKSIISFNFMLLKARKFSTFLISRGIYHLLSVSKKDYYNSIKLNNLKTIF